ncbi:UbiA family prenyltransferase [Candidatus Micrarchaeota archaeon]|nr:UbiA family prenyltransferase [Candidatus Micrarchaeota archaeon]
MNIKAIPKLIRFEHGLMLSLAVLISIFLTVSEINWGNKVYILLALPFLIEAGAFALNDFFDVETDTINRKNRPIVKGEISKESAFIIGSGSLFIAIILSLLTENLLIINLTGFFAFFSVLYNWKLKDMPLMGNIYIGFSMAIPFLFGNLAFSNSIVPENFILFSMAFIVGVSREIIKTVEDYKGDRKARGSKTLPFYIGEKKSLMFAGSLIGVFILLGIYSFTMLKFSIFSGLLWLAALMYYMYLCFSIIYTKETLNFKSIKRYTLITMFLGLIAVLLTKFSI